MASRDRIVINSERDAWQHVARLSSELQDKAKTIHYAREAGITLEAIAAGMLRQLNEGLHMNPSKRKR